MTTTYLYIVGIDAESEGEAAGSLGRALRQMEQNAYLASGGGNFTLVWTPDVAHIEVKP